jgi:hypothetical protein
MTQTRWAIDGPDDTGLELEGRRFSSNDEGAPMMCNLVCSSMGRHVHIDYCRAGANAPCDGAEVQHINARMVPDPDRTKDAITHSLHWRRLGTLDINIYGFSLSLIHIYRIQRSRHTFSAPIETDIDSQTRTLVMNRRIFQNGASLLGVLE